jgi:hypothetical protein
VEFDIPLETNVPETFELLPHGVERHLVEELEVAVLFPARLGLELEPIDVLGLTKTQWKLKCKQWDSQFGRLSKPMQRQLSALRIKVRGRYHAQQKRQRKADQLEAMASTIESLEARLETAQRALRAANLKSATRAQTF